MDIAQVLVNSLVRASELSLLAVGLTMVFGILKFPNVAHGDYAMLGGYFVFALAEPLGASLLLAVPLAMIAFGVLGVGLDWAVFRPLRQRGAAVFTQLIASMGLALLLRNVVRMIWSTETRTYEVPLVRPLEFLGATIGPLEIGIVVTGVVFMVAFHLGLNYTKLGKGLRAISDDPELASACAIDTEKMIRWLWFIACAYAALGGFMLALEHALFPRLGFNILMPVFGAALVGGIGNPYGAMLGALVIGLAENIILGTNFGALLGLGGLFDVGEVLVPTGYKPAVSFIIIILVLLFRPVGLLGRR
jgi:branched-subunit amino acid ABC-type transport system permease component